MAYLVFAATLTCLIFACSGCSRTGPIRKVGSVEFSDQVHTALPADRGHSRWAFAGVSTVGVCNIRSGEVTWSQSAPDGYAFVSLRPDRDGGRIAAILINKKEYEEWVKVFQGPTPGPCRIWILESDSGRIVERIKGPRLKGVVSRTDTMRWSEDGDRLFLLRPSKLSAWDIKSKKKLWESMLPFEVAKKMGLAPWMDMNGEDKIFVWERVGFSIWDGDSGKVERKHRMPKGVGSIAAEWSGKFVYITSLKLRPPMSLLRFNLETEEFTTVAELKGKTAHWLEVSPDGHWLAVDMQKDLGNLNRVVRIYRCRPEADFVEIGHIEGLYVGDSCGWTSDGRIGVWDEERLTVWGISDKSEKERQ